ncbi:MAG TPA: N-acetylneuraminate synthase family protein [Spirochaetota bacterium]|nr:N-acetylneuraminate synthase family protein [Spirochaetota bacterium]OPZ39714.1 MAG: N,N'-diacetyllegionaminic acid synthase [Spirochaetes bacterium ADurb.BinA120]HNU92998.1 N-acetylneuraminate synthase family protein [Spirochaetota bacterium]HPI15466.1 N-acetylneuraminate synthase family protein [Spirochaetota bacterium]HPO46156.1 N-acetylneuraminate synthase family protein [Spirochaetota bacterium]
MKNIEGIFRGGETFFIAEIGINHNGSPKEARAMIRAAASAGADAVKFQTFVPEEMYSRYTSSMLRNDKALTADFSQIEFFKRFVIGEDDLKSLKNEAEARGLIFFSSAFDIPSVEMLERLGVPMYKLASSEVTNTPLLERVGRTQKPVIMSTGISTGAEIGRAIDTLRSFGTRELVLLHCVALYPLGPENANLSRISSLSSMFALPVGFSDHAVDGAGCALAAMLGARVFEKHFMPAEGYDCPDAAVSLHPASFMKMREDVERAVTMFGHGGVDYDFSEKEVAKSARRSLFSGRPLSAGEELRRDAIAVKRPGVGLPIADMERLLGRRLLRDIPEDFPLRFEDLE